MSLRLERVSKRYPRPGGGWRVALDGVSLEVDRGQMVGVFGPSGSGKTTLLQIAAGMQRPDEGTVIYDGERLDEMSASGRTRFRRREIACVWAGQVWQRRLSVLDHVSLPLLVDGRDHHGAERRAREALLVCEAEHCVGMELDELSDGERQRVAIARALVSEPRLLLADGPVSRLSLIEQEAIMVLLCSLAREAKVAVLIADSDAEALLRADPVLYLCDGKLVNPEPASERGRIYRFPPARARRAAGDA
ncbi:MAG TPA: ATP-binding cassette domain-containing protein [Solirubrobacteraceae bacterium]|nr:ATP-binding cassette domain-containing protein [Solirubrobacteraceae bacterium]